MLIHLCHSDITIVYNNYHLNIFQIILSEYSYTIAVFVYHRYRNVLYQTYISAIMSEDKLFVTKIWTWHFFQEKCALKFFRIRSLIDIFV